MASPQKTPKVGIRPFIAVKNDGSKVALSTRLPTKREQDFADLEGSATYNRSLMGGLPTRVRLIRELRKQELWKTEDDEELNNGRTQLAKFDSEIRVLTPVDEKEVIKPEAKEKLNQLNAERLELIGRLNQLRSDIDSMLAHTADARAEEAQRQFLIACVTEFADGDNRGKRLFASVEDLRGCQDEDLVNHVVYEFLMRQNDLPSDWDELNKIKDNAGDKKKDETDKDEKPVEPATLPVTPPVDSQTPPVANTSEEAPPPQTGDEKTVAHVPV